MLGLIISESVPNSILYHIHENSLGYFEDSYNIRHLPKPLQPLARIGCSGCKVILKANMTERPNIVIDRNGIVLILEGNLGAYFFRQNTTYELLTADGVFRVILKPQFRHSLVFSDVQLTGVDFKVYKADLKGMFSTTAKKLLNFIIPKTIWPKIQKSLRFAINRRGFQIPSICGVEFEKPHIGYIKHAAIITADFKFNLPHFLQVFQKFMKNN
uniref:Lipid-binding serum glycoprotein C-terminal domain-containing protein n=1 Tax=Panagrolaimus davidi TaxID=227884 RepID=A0A914Q1A7_9BILA